MTPWERATTALALLAIDSGLGGLTIRARSGPVRDALVACLPALPLPLTRLHPAMTGEALDGGIDLSATLNAGTLTQTRGLLNAPSTLVLAMAERAEPYLAARLSATLDRCAGHLVIAMDEGLEDEAIAPSLADRLAFHVDLDGIARADIGAAFVAPEVVLHDVEMPDDLAETLVLLAVRLGIISLRAVGFALRAAKAHALLQGRTLVAEADVSAAVALVFAHRATMMPADEEQDDTPPPDQDPQDQEPPTPEEMQGIPDDILLDAIKAALPASLLEDLQSGKASASAKGAGSGQKKIGNRRGRPLPAREGGAASARVDLIATLRAAIPWQTLRKRQQSERTGPIIQRSDLRRKRYQDHSDRLLIFVVDASGSAAMSRLGEAKGAIELLLAQAYARRDHVALISFRGSEAEVLLSPTRSLVQTKRKLAALPGGGATPLAAGLMAADEMARQSTRKGFAPTVIVLTDGRSNMTLDGTPDRAQAAADSRLMAQALASQGAQSIVIDTGRRAEPALADLARVMRGRYLALPRADAQSVSAAVTQTLEA
jgi:magnesium chelatase subunit D